MWFKFGCIALLVFVACTGADESIETQEADRNLSQWYSSPVDLFEKKTVQSRVIVGQPAQRRQLPWHVLITSEAGAEGSWSVSTRTLAGSLISSHYVLSEANGLRFGNRWECVLGAHDRNDRRVVRRSTKAFYHPDSNPGQGNFNVGILQLDRGFSEWSRDIRPVQLASSSKDYSGRHAWVSGFGTSCK